jgi:hypothetical protein
MGLLITSGVLAFLAWCIIDTDLKAEQVCNSRGEITVRRVLAVVSVQIVLWTLVCICAFPIVRHFPHFLVTGWRLRFTFLFAGFWQWFALLMVLQYVWVIVRATGKTTTMAVLAAFGSGSAKQSLDAAPFRFMRGRKQEERFRSRDRDSEP